MKININNTDITLTVGNPSQFPRDPRPEIALSGRSNVGKSSLINTLLGRKSLARVSSAPGKTVTINYYTIDGKMHLVDLPGYGFAQRSRGKQLAFSSLTEDFFLKNPSHDALKLVLQLVDVRTGPTEDDVLMMNFMLDKNIPFLVVYTKTDKLSATALKETTARYADEYFTEAGIETIAFSSVTRVGKDALWTKIFDAVGV